jgi:nitrite reductase/ring-hydroxylating ferredoxin subunit
MSMERELLLGRDGEIAEGSIQRMTAADIDFCVTRLHGQIRVVEDRCPHMSVPLSFGTLEGCIVTCPQHRAQFNLSDYSLAGPPIMGGGGGGAGAAASQPLDPEAAARAERRREMMSSVRTKPLVVFPVIERDGNVYVVLPNEA